MHKKIRIHIVLANSDDFHQFQMSQFVPFSYTHDRMTPRFFLYKFDLMLLPNCGFNLFQLFSSKSHLMLSTRSHQSERKPVNIEKIIYN